MSEGKQPDSILSAALKQEALDKLLASCPLCQNRQGSFITSVISESRDAELVHARCSICQGALVALLFSTGPIISSIGLVTDLSLEDVSRFQHSQAITEDDLLTFHEWLHHGKSVNQLLKYSS
ncbi:MAG: hypothetical protein ACD_43C00211G0003 [uncultured bacterium]|nr:MAG: hypothetical protein ACD_43C00211G0003 [uncultured bacterium]